MTEMTQQNAANILAISTQHFLLPVIIAKKEVVNEPKPISAENKEIIDGK